MSKKKHPEHVNHERWLVSYADFITLLFAFFVVLFASSQGDKKKSAALATAMKSAFDQYGVFEAHAKTPPLTQGAGATAEMVPAALAIAPPVPTAEQRAVESTIRKLLSGSIQSGSISVRRNREGLVLSLREAGFFQSGSAEIDPGALPLLYSLAAGLPNQALRIEGHTDNMPIHNERFRSNWELSTARANEIARVLMEQSKVAPACFAIAGYGEFHPTASNDSPSGRAQNRRVDIVLLNGPAATSLRPAPLR